MTLEWVLAAMLLLAPQRDHTELAGAVARVVDESRPLFVGDEGKTKTTALLVAVSFRESSFNNAAKSKTNDHCAFQINGKPALAEDVDACVRTAMAMLRESMRICPSHPIAFYAEGPKGCTSPRAQRISRDRMNLAAWIARRMESAP